MKDEVEEGKDDGSRIEDEVEAPVRVSRKCCARCGERIRGSVYRMNQKTLCGLCVEDEIEACCGRR